MLCAGGSDGYDHVRTFEQIESDDWVKVAPVCVSGYIRNRGARHSHSGQRGGRHWASRRDR
jgi:hypothetical protein